MFYCVHVECRGFESHLRQLIFSRKSDCLGCAVLLCLVCLFDLACFFLPSFSSLIKKHVHVCSGFQWEGGGGGGWREGRRKNGD